jgi:DNA-binding GntR family transcriptional regulator
MEALALLSGGAEVLGIVRQRPPRLALPADCIRATNHHADNGEASTGRDMAVSNGITSAPKGSEPPAQLARHAADAVRDMIRRGELLPGEKVHQVDIAKIAGVSRSPLREALRTLEAEGLVRYETNRGYVVSRLRLEELAELYELRSLIETEIIASVKKPSAGVIRRMERHVAAMEAAVERNDFPTVAEAYRGFRSQLFTLSDRIIFRREVERLWQMTDTYNAAYVMPPFVAEQALTSHREIIAALKANDIPRVIEIEADMRSLREHIIVGLSALPRR